MRYTLADASSVEHCEVDRVLAANPLRFTDLHHDQIGGHRSEIARVDDEKVLPDDARTAKMRIVWAVLTRPGALHERKVPIFV